MHGFNKKNYISEKRLRFLNSMNKNTMKKYFLTRVFPAYCKKKWYINDKKGRKNPNGRKNMFNFLILLNDEIYNSLIYIIKSASYMST